MPSLFWSVVASIYLHLVVFRVQQKLCLPSNYISPDGWDGVGKIAAIQAHVDTLASNQRHQDFIPSRPGILLYVGSINMQLLNIFRLSNSYSEGQRGDSVQASI
jgi:hypothetical protein